MSENDFVLSGVERHQVVDGHQEDLVKEDAEVKRHQVVDGRQEDDLVKEDAEVDDAQRVGVLTLVAPVTPRGIDTHINLGSLLRLFKSDFFDSWILVSYLYRYQQQGVHDYLVNQLYSIGHQDVEKFLPQLTNLVCNVRLKSNSLRRFMLDLCTKSMHLALKFYWLLSSFIDDDDEHNRQFTVTLREAVEECIVNCKRPDQRFTPSQQTGGDAEATFLAKHGRLHFFENVTMLIESLCSLSDMLRNVDIPKRRQILVEKLKEINEIVKESGVYIPLYSAADAHHTLIEIPPEEAILLQSRDRVPFMLFAEVQVNADGVASSSTPNLHKVKHRVDERRFMKLSANSFSTFDDEELVEDVVVQVDDIPENMRESLMKKSLSSPQLTAEEQMVVDQEQAKKQETWAMREKRMRKVDVSGWALRSFIVKYGDDCRQELLAVQMIQQIYDIFLESELSLWLQPNSIMVVHSEAALIETIKDVQSIHQIKKANPKSPSLLSHFLRHHSQNAHDMQKAQLAFIQSLAGYSIVSYLLQLKDRHNGNILIDAQGHVIHIDFGYMLGISPGSMSFETAPFKLTREYLRVMGGAEGMAYFKALLVQGFLKLQTESQKVVLLVEMMTAGRGKGMARQNIECLKAGNAVAALKQRFQDIGKTEDAVMATVENMVTLSLDNSSTNMYDAYQYYANGYLY